MARVVFASAAYLGDVAPFVGPANQLADRGHDVTFLTPAGFHPLLSGERFRLAAYSSDFSPAAMHADPTHERLMRHPFVNQLRLARYWMRQGLVADPVGGRNSLLNTLSGADAVVSHPTFGSAVVPVARHLGLPTVIGQLFPMMMPTAQWAPPIPRHHSDWGQHANRLAWKALARASGQIMYDRQMNAHRHSLGVPPLGGTAMLSWTEATRTVVLVSRHYFGDEAEDWPGWTLAGFSPWAGPAGDLVNHEVDAFFDDGDAPVLVCLGTSAASAAGAAFATIANGLDRLGLRPLLLVGNPANLGTLGRRRGAFSFVPMNRVIGLFLRTDEQGHRPLSPGDRVGSAGQPGCGAHGRCAGGRDPAAI
jgi:sterol 3beta-glucosyltransferase